MLSHETSPLRDPNDFTFIDPANGQRLAYPGNTDLWKWTNIPGFNKSKFAWTSSQTLNANYPPQRAGAVELQLDRDGNTYAELAASQSGTAIYQKIATTPGVAYTVRLSHASQSAATGMDRLQVLIGPQGRERPVEMTRTTSNKAGDRIGETSTVVATRATNTVDSVVGGPRGAGARRRAGAAHAGVLAGRGPVGEGPSGGRGCGHVADRERGGAAGRGPAARHGPAGRDRVRGARGVTDAPYLMSR